MTKQFTVTKQSEATKTVMTTGIGEVLFMSAARPFTDANTGKSAYSVRVHLKADDPAIGTLLEKASAKIETKNNMKLKDGSKIVSFESTYAPNVTDSEGNKLKMVPFFNGKTDKAKVKVEFVILDYGKEFNVVRLQGIQIMELDIAPKDGEKSLSEVEAELSKI